MAGDDASPPRPTRIESNSSSYLGPQDRPGDFITPTRLRGDNYVDWAADIQTALEARRKFEFLDGTITKPVPPCTQSDWNAINAMLISWITNTIDPEVKSSISKYKEATKLWDTLRSRYAVVNGPRIQQLYSAIAKCEQTKTMLVASYFANLNGLWEELHHHEPLIDCSCCTSCTAGTKHQVRRETGMLHQFLMGLYSDYYAQTRASILSQNRLPSLDRAYQLVIQDERVHLAKSIPEDKNHEAVGFVLHTGAGRGRGRMDRPNRSHLVCSHCKKTGHEATCCFELIGYPKWFEGRVKADGGGRGRGRTGGRGRGSVRANAAATSHGGGTAEVAASNTSNSSSSPQLFSAEQWKALAGLLGNVTIPENRLSENIGLSGWSS